MNPLRSTLFVGGLVLQDLAAACASGADLVCIDLEDAVPPEGKAQARQALLLALDTRRTAATATALIVRVNETRTAEGQADLDALVGRDCGLHALLLPKVETPDEVGQVGQRLDQAAVSLDMYAIIETTAGLEHCAAIARAHPRLKALFFGGYDLSTALGCAMDWEPLLYARSRVVHAAAGAQIQVLDSPYAVVDDLEGLAADCARARALGMTGKCAKHLNQVSTIRRAFSPSAAEIARARLIVERFRADPTRPLVHEGRLIERPAIKRLERIAALDPEH